MVLTGCAHFLPRLSTGAGSRKPRAGSQMVGSAHCQAGISETRQAMIDQESYAAGTVYFFGSKEALAEVLTSAGFAVEVGQWALRFEQFEIGYVGNIDPKAPFEIHGDGYDIPAESLAVQCSALAECLTLAMISFDFTHIAGDRSLEYRTYQFRL